MKTRIQFPSYQALNKEWGESASEIQSHLLVLAIDGFNIKSTPRDHFVSYMRKNNTTENSGFSFMGGFGLSIENEINTNWKIHLSCHPDDIGKMWDVAVPFLIEKNVIAFKVIRMHKNKENEIHLRAVANLQITIYLRQGYEVDIITTLNEIEKALKQNNVKIADAIDDSDLKIGDYTSVRYPSYKGKYLNAEQAKQIAERKNLPRYKLDAPSNPFSGINLVANNYMAKKRNTDYSKEDISDDENELTDTGKKRKKESDIALTKQNGIFAERTNLAKEDDPTGHNTPKREFDN